MAAERNQADIVCRYCGQSITSVSELRRHNDAHCQQSVTTVLSAKAKHGTTLGEHHAEIAKHSFKDLIDRHYHEIMLAEMTLELVLILLLVILAWK